MAYLELQDLLEELGEDVLVQLTDNEGTGEVDEVRVEKAIQYAVSTFDAHARSRYKLPVPVTPFVKAICLDLAVFHLFKSRSTIKDGVYEIRKNANDDAVKRLLDLSMGKIALDVPAVDETKENPATSDRILTNAAKSKFSDNALKGF